MGKPAPDLVVLHIHRLEGYSPGADFIKIMALENTVATLKADLQKALKSVQKLKAQRARREADRIAAEEAERLEDEAHAAQVAELEKRIAEGTASDEEKALLAQLVAELDEEDGPDDEDPPAEDGTTPSNP